ncbi:hypothetical protein ACJ73_09347 [Blastomyces percursus]|uniref:Uncharacterized protein n=1 Tax=Blastomyces percursus TaxID=1658174 RepID=A0A1J9QBB4_9EURO|nr:hypothetical protein ACJ73_09347 [Blastomyces percursus]
MVGDEMTVKHALYTEERSRQRGPEPEQEPSHFSGRLIHSKRKVALPSRKQKAESVNLLRSISEFHKETPSSTLVSIGKETAKDAIYIRGRRWFEKKENCKGEEREDEKLSNNEIGNRTPLISSAEEDDTKPAGEK